MLLITVIKNFLIKTILFLIAPSILSIFTLHSSLMINEVSGSQSVQPSYSTKRFNYLSIMFNIQCAHNINTIYIWRRECCRLCRWEVSPKVFNRKPTAYPIKELIIYTKRKHFLLLVSLSCTHVHEYIHSNRPHHND